MQQDLHGLPISAASGAAAAAFNDTVTGYLKYRADTPARLQRALDADAEFGLARCLQGYLAMTSFKQANVAVASSAAEAARPMMGKATAREKAHLAALDCWIAGEFDRTIAAWEAILGEHPTDVLAFRLAHFVNFWLGRPRDMRASAERVSPQWSSDLPGYGALLSCLCFAREECGDYAAAEPAGWDAVALDPADFWGVHALAHVMEMQGRQGDGIALVNATERHVAGGNNLVHHLWWHRGLFHFERREFDIVLDLYDRRFRNLGSPLTAAAPDLYIDVQNGASMLFRLERFSVDVGDRWEEIADHAERRIGDGLSAFTLPHWMMALAATGRDAAAQRMLDGLRDFAAGPGTVQAIVRDVGLPITTAVFSHARGEHERAVDLMMAALPRRQELGGSHAQQDVLLQLAADAAVKAGRATELRLLLAEAARARSPAIEHRAAYAELARIMVS